MRTVPTLVIATLVALPGLAAAFTSAAAPAAGLSFPDKLVRVDRDGLTPNEWVRAMMVTNSPIDLTHATFTQLEVPAGHTIVGQVVDGAFKLSVVPDADVAPHSTTQAGTGLEPGRDCLNDVIDSTYGSTFYLTANLFYPAAPNIASAGLCNGSPGLFGPVNYFTFRVTGDSGGWLYLSDGSSAFEIGCYPMWDGAATAMAGAGAGVGSQFQNTLQVANSRCEIAQVGYQPSAWYYHYGIIANWNSDWGDAYGSTLTSGVPLGNFP